MRQLTRKAMRDHFNWEAFLSCRRQMDDHDLQFTAQRAHFLRTMEAMQRAASRYLLHCGKLFDPAAVELDVLAGEMFDIKMAVGFSDREGDA